MMWNETGQPYLVTWVYLRINGEVMYDPTYYPPAMRSEDI